MDTSICCDPAKRIVVNLSDTVLLRLPMLRPQRAGIRQPRATGALATNALGRKHWKPQPRRGVTRRGRALT